MVIIAVICFMEYIFHKVKTHRSVFFPRPCAYLCVNKNKMQTVKLSIFLNKVTKIEAKNLKNFKREARKEGRKKERKKENMK